MPVDEDNIWVVADDAVRGEDWERDGRTYHRWLANIFIAHISFVISVSDPSSARSSSSVVVSNPPHHVLTHKVDNVIGWTYVVSELMSFYREQN